jgi:hypothetical protein
MAIIQKNSDSPLSIRHNLTWAIHIFIVVLPFFLLILPPDFFDQGQSICISKALLNMECYGCGMTRAVMHFIHFDFATAWSFNKLVFLIVPLLFPIWLKSLLFIFGKQLPPLLRRFY